MWNTRIASAYWNPRKTSSSSFSRWISVLINGIMAATMMLSTVSATISMTML